MALGTIAFSCFLSANLEGGTLSINVGRDLPALRVTFLGYFSGTDAYFCGFLLGPVHIFAHFLGPMPMAYICTPDQLALLKICIVKTANCALPGSFSLLVTFYNTLHST